MNRSPTHPKSTAPEPGTRESKRIALASVIGLTLISASIAATTATFKGTFVDRSSAANPITYSYIATIQSPVTNTGFVINTAGTIPGSSQANWRDPQGATIQGDGRYTDPTRSNGLFVLGLTHAISPNHPTVTTAATVHFMNGVADGVWVGKDVNGIVTGTGKLAAAKVGKLDQQRMAEVGDPVQVGTGAVIVRRTLFALSGGRTWSFDLAYNSILAMGQDTPGAVGYGWTHAFETKIQVSGSNRVLQWDLTRSSTFVPKAGDPSAYVCADDVARYDVLTTQAGGGWLLTHRDQSARLFDANGRLVEDRDSHGRKLVLTYDGSGRIAKINDPVAGANLSFAYVFGTQRIDTISDATGAVVSFGYTSGQLLNRIVNQNGKQVTFTYDTNRALLTAVDHLGTLLASNTYDASGRVITQDDGVPGNLPLAFSYIEQGLPGNNLYAASDAAKAIPLPLPVSQFFKVSSFTGLDGQTINYNYDVADRLTSAVVNNQTTTVSYDGQGNVASVTDPAGQTSMVSQSIKVVVTDRTGRPATYQFDPDYNLRSLTNALNQITRYDYDAQNNLTAVTDALNCTTRFTYDATGNVLSMTDPAGGVTTHTYDSRGNLLTTTDPLANAVTRTYDARNNLLTETDSLGHITTWTYDAGSQPLTKTLPRGGVYQYAYAAGQLVQSTDPAGVITRFGYDPNGRLLFREDAVGKRTTYAYDPIGNVRSVTNALNQTAAYTYDHRNRLIEEEDPLGAVTTYAYDNNGNLLTTTDAFGKITTQSFDGEDRLQAIEDPLHRITGHAYDEAGRLISITGPAGEVTRYDHDAEGRQTSVTSALGQRTTFGYDVRGLIKSVADPLNRSSEFAFDEIGRWVTTTDPLNRFTKYDYDLVGRLMQVTDPGGTVATKAFDEDGNQVALTNPLLATTGFGVDASGRLTSVRTPEGSVTSYGYNSRGLLASVSAPSGRTVGFGYDDASRLNSIVDAVGTTTLSRDANGRLLAVAENGRVISREYDLLGRLTSYANGDGNTIGYAYDDLGRLIRLIYPGGQTVSYSYNAAGRLRTVTDWAGRVTTYTFDAVGQMTGLSRPNGTKQTREYDMAGQVIRLAEYGPDGSTVFLSEDFEYDAGGQLTHENVVPAIDSPLASMEQTFDRENRLLTHNGARVEFDADGNLLSVVAGIAPASYTYDARNRLTSAGGISYAYDAENRRTAQTSAGGTTRMVVNPNAALDQVLVRTAADGTKTFYVYGLGLLHEETGSSVRYYHCDRRGDAVALTDGVGAVTDRMSYGPYGELVSHSGTTNTPFMFNAAWGVQTDGNGLYFHRARYYHPALRRFLNQDPLLGTIAKPATLNRFAYTSGNPLSCIDPTGFYNRDVHHDLTRDLAIRAGFTSTEAESIAAADQGTDDDPNTGPYASRAARRDFHFTTAERREQLLREANEAMDFARFGQYLHAEQDSYSHQRGLTDRDGDPYGPVMGHFLAGHGPDKTSQRPELAVRMAERTYQQLRNFREVMYGKKRCDDWENIRPAVDQWARTERPD